MPRYEYGPPGHKGVTSIMGIGDTELALPKDPIRKVTYASVAVWGLGFFLGNDSLRNIGFGASAAMYVVYMAKKKAEATVVPVVVPTTTQGW